MAEKQPFEDGSINWQEYEMVPEQAPPDETPRQFVLRMTGRDLSELSYQDRDFTWQELKDAGAMPNVVRILETTSQPRLVFRLKKKVSE